jgi:hypothetical protein
MEELVSKALVRTILHHAEDYPWKIQDIGLLGLRLDDRREFRLHVWDPTYSTGDDDPPIHDHPYDFTSTIIAGEMTNTVYEEDPGGDECTRYRYVPSDESAVRARPSDFRGMPRPTRRAAPTDSWRMSSTTAGNSLGRFPSSDAHSGMSLV